MKREHLGDNGLSENNEGTMDREDGEGAMEQIVVER